MLDRHKGSDGRVWWVRILTALAILVVLAVAGTTVRMTLRTGLDLVMLGALAWVAFHSLPLLGRYFEQRVFDARFAEARKRPVEELMERHLERREQLRRDKVALTTLVGRFDSGWREVHELLESHGVALFQGAPAKT